MAWVLPTTPATTEWGQGQGCSAMCHRHIPKGTSSQVETLPEGSAAGRWVRSSLAKGTVAALAAREETSLAVPPWVGLPKLAAPPHASSWEKIQSKGKLTNEGDFWPMLQPPTRNSLGKAHLVLMQPGPKQSKALALLRHAGSHTAPLTLQHSSSSQKQPSARLVLCI